MMSVLESTPKVSLFNYTTTKVEPLSTVIVPDTDTGLNIIFSLESEKVFAYGCIVNISTTICAVCNFTC